MAKHSSQMYGIKLKEKTNYRIFDDPKKEKDIKLSFSNGVWTITSLYDNLWMNGVQYHKNDVVATFNDGDDVEYVMIAQYTDTTPYTNYTYRVIGNVLTNIHYGNKEVSYKIVTEDTTNFKIRVYKYENGIRASSEEVSTTKIIQYRNRYEGEKYPVYNLLFDWHAMDQGYPQMSFECISNSNYIKYEGQTKSKNETIRTWQGASSVNFDIVDDTNKHQASKMSKDAFPIVTLSKKIGLSDLASAEEDRKTINKDVYHTHKDVYYNGKWHDAMYLVYDNAASDVGCFHTIAKVPGIALTWADPYWFLMTTQSGIEYGGRTYEARKLLRSWKPSESVNMTLKKYVSRNKYKVDKNDYETIIYDLETNVEDGCLNIQKSETANNDQTTIYPQNTPCDFYNISIKVEGNEWVIISKYGNIKYGNHTYGKNREIVRFAITDDVTLQLQDFNNKKTLQKEITAGYETILYDIQMESSNNNVTVIMQSMNETEDINGRTVKNYSNLDTANIAPSDSPFTFHNIQFRIDSNLTKWTVISKCRYIQYNGRNYPLNRSIIDLPTNEDVHIQIKDETNKYEVEEELTYTIKSAQVVGTYYSIHTAEGDKSIKVVKTVNSVEEPWVTVRYYDAMYENFVVDDIKFDFNNRTMNWGLISNNDNLYYGGTNYKKHSTITEWNYNEIVKISGISITQQAEDGIEVKLVSSKSQNKNQDLDVFVPEEVEEEEADLKIFHSASKASWTIKSNNDDVWSNGINYRKGDTILTFKDKIIIDPFSILARHWDEEHQEFENVMYQVYSTVDVLNDITTLYLNMQGGAGYSYNSKDTNPKDISLLFTKEKMKSLYGYIWKRDRGPGPTPPSQDPDIIIYIQYAAYSSGSGERGRLLGITNSANFTVQTLIDRTGSSSNYPSIRYAKGNRLYVNPLYYTDDFGHTAMKSMTVQFSPVYYRNGYPIDFNPSDTPTVSGTGAIILDKYKYAFLITGESLNYCDYLVTYEVDLLGRLNKISEVMIYDSESKPVDNLINQIKSGANNIFNYYFGATFGKSGYRPDPTTGQSYLVNWTEYSILNINFQSIVDNPFDSAFGSLFNQYHIYDHENPWAPGVSVYQGVEYYDSGTWRALEEQTQWHHYNIQNTGEDAFVPNGMYTTASNVMYSCFHLRRRYYEQVSATSWRTLYQDLGWYYSVYDIDNDTCSINRFVDDETERQRMLDIIGRCKLYKGDVYSYEIIDDELHILQVSKTNPFIWQVVKSKDVGSTVSLKLYNNRSGDSTFVTITLGTNALYSPSNRTCGINPISASIGAIYSGSNGGAINNDNYWRYRVRIDGYQNKYINLVFDNPYFDGGGLGFAFLDDI